MASVKDFLAGWTTKEEFAARPAVKRIYAACPREFNAAIPYLRRAGFSKIESMMAVIDLFGLSMQDAKGAVHLHPAWAEEHARDERVHDACERIANGDAEA